PGLVGAIQNQAAKLQHVILGGMSHPPIIELAERLADIAPGDLQYSFFCGDGASAVEAALKIALQYWVNIGVPGKTRFVGLVEGYHGDTLGAIGVGYVESFHKDYLPAVTRAHRACSPHCLQCPFGKEPTSCDIECFGPMEEILREHHQEIAAVVVEPLCQGAAGVRIYPEEYLRRLRRLCDELDILLIADEIAVGFGRTGSMFACGRAGITPDIMTIGKGLTGGMMPMSATMVTPDVYNSFRNGEDGVDRTFYHSHTYGGNPVTAALAVEALRIYEEEAILEKVAIRGKQLDAGFAKLSSLLPGTRHLSLGMIAVMEFPDEHGGPDRARAIGRTAMAEGLLVRPRGRAVYLWPPLTTTEAELEAMLKILEQAITETGNTRHT
ncbi:MAG: adenosylmethionine--8-amino-7-oxononanoate transaminase, partial [Candidatus Sumerlaeia bacterium]|nr:adenosylmethionine--8-amino-7-oxononanoate transaminase [Candidatus Sumerlaeia bacterium]